MKQVGEEMSSYHVSETRYPKLTNNSNDYQNNLSEPSGWDG